MGPKSGLPKEAPFVKANFSKVALYNSHRVSEHIIRFMWVGLPYKHCIRMWFSTKALYYKVKFLSVLWTYTFPHNSSSMEEFHLFHGKGPLLSTGPKGGLLSMLLFVLQKLLTVISAKHFRVPCIFIWVSPTWNN